MKSRAILFLAAAGFAAVLLAALARRRSPRPQLARRPPPVRDAEPTVPEPIQPEQLNVAQNAPF
jgi:hypothetical protein